VSGAPELEELRNALRSQSYVEGQNLVIESKWANGNASELRVLAQSLVDARVDLICTIASEASFVAKSVTSNIPIVFARAAFPEQTKLVGSLARPGANVTGVAFVGLEYGKRLQILREASPRLARVALIYNDANPGAVLALKETQRWAEQLGMTIDPHSIHDKAEVENMFAAMAKNPPGGLLTTADPIVTSFRKEIAEFALKHKLVSMFPTPDFVQAGGLMSYGTNMTEMYRQVASIIDRILRGARPAELPIEQPTKFGRLRTS
jgi:putative ABC transport system substrate-binding protein